MEPFKRPRRADGLAIGGDVDARCGRCKRESGHTITAMVGEEVAQVRCDSCNAIHKYRPTEAAKEKSQLASGIKKERLSADVRDYRRLISGRDKSEAYKHNLFRRPVEGDLLKHKKFGLGYVQSVGMDKAEVLFPAGKQTLIVCR
jgi:hypothetical protein